MNSKDILYSSGKNDECYTYKYAVLPILEFIPKEAVVWCPFDDEESEFVKQISKKNKVVHTHIHTGQDFFTYEPENWDIIVSNPPFTNKRKYFERALSFNKPFALIMTNTWLSDSSSKTVFSNENKQLQLLMFDNRMNFRNTDGRENNKITFSSSYFCYNLLPRDLILWGKLDIPKQLN